MAKLGLKRYAGILRQLSLEVHELWRGRPRLGGVLTAARTGLVLRYLGLALLALAAATSSLTFYWILDHDRAANWFPEFAGRVVYISDISLLAGLVFWGMGWYLAPRQPLNYGPRYVFLPLLVLTLFSVLSVIWAGDSGQAGYTALRRVFLLAMYVILVNEAARSLAPMIIVLLGVGLLQGGVAWGQGIEGKALGLTLLGEIPEGALAYPAIGNPRAYGLGFNPNPLALFLAAVSALAYGLFLLTRGDWHIRALTIVPFLVTYVGLRATESRTNLIGWLLAFAVLSLLAWLGRGEARWTVAKRFALAALLVLLAEGYTHITSPQGMPDQPGVATLPSSGIQSVSRRFSSEEISSGLGGRRKDAEVSLPTIRENLLLGVGAGNYSLALKARLAPEAFGPPIVPVHNVPLFLYAELGIIGGTSWLFLMLTPLMWALPRLRARSFGLYPLVYLGPLLVLLFDSIFDFYPWATQDGRVLMMAVAGLWAGVVVAANKKCLTT